MWQAPREVERAFYCADCGAYRIFGRVYLVRDRGVYAVKNRRHGAEGRVQGRADRRFYGIEHARHGAEGRVHLAADRAGDCVPDT